MNRSVTLGFIFFIALVLLGFGTLMLERGNNPFESTYEIRVVFDRIHGLRIGDEVRVEGLSYGNVHDIDLQSPGVLVTLRLKKKRPLVLYDNYSITIESSSVLGGSLVMIRRGGPPHRPLFPTPEALQKELLAGTVRAGLEEVGTIVDENRENFRQLVANLKDVSQNLKEGRGTAGLLLKSDELHAKLVTTLEEVRRAAELANARLKSEFIDATLSNLAEATSNLKTITESLQKSEGPLGALINDKTMTQRLNKTLEDVQKTGENLRIITDKVQSGQGPLGKLVNDVEMGEKLKKTVDNIEQSSEAIKNITGKLQSGEGSVGKLLQDDELYEKAKQTLDDIDKVFAKAARAVVDIVAESAYYNHSHEQISKLGVRLIPSEDKFIYVGAAAMSLSTKGDILFSREVEQGKNDTIIRGDLMVGYRVPWFLDRRLTVRAGLLEGKLGGGVDLRWDEWGLFNHPVQITFEGRQAYNDVQRYKIDELLNGPLARAYLKVPLWNRRDNWFELLLSTLSVTAGVNRIGNNAEYSAGISMEWPDDDIRTLVGFIGLAR